MNEKNIKILSDYTDDIEVQNEVLIRVFLKNKNINNINNVLIQKYISRVDKGVDGIVNKIIKIYDNQNFEFHDLIKAFELLVPPKDQVTNGAIYTPEEIKRFITQNVFDRKVVEIQDSRVCDISCGCGAFLYTAAKEIKSRTSKTYKEIFSENIYGLDISEYCIDRTKILLTLLAIIYGEDEEHLDFNLITDNALKFQWLEEFSEIKANNGFDYIIGNPPYVRAKNISEESKSHLNKWKVTQSGNTDLYLAFFEIGIKYLKPNGLLGYITVNSFFRSMNGRALRLFFKTQGYHLQIINLNGFRIFKDKLTYNCICFITKSDKGYIEYIEPENNIFKDSQVKSFNKIFYKNLNSKKGWTLNNPEVAKIIDKLENKGIKLGDIAIIKNGIATLNNDFYIFNPIKEDEVYYYRKYEGIEYKIEKNICREILKPNITKSEDQISAKKEKLIFPYHDLGNQVELLVEEKLKSKYPQTYNFFKDYRSLLDTRDKGKGNYKNWYAFGRSQALTDKGFKLMFPYMAKEPVFVLTDQEDLMIYCGYAIYSDSIDELKVYKKILMSDLFWFYMKNTSKPYSSGYYSFAKSYVESFSIVDLNEDEKKLLLNEESKNEVENFLLKKYGIDELPVF